jgi:RES domain-containing protein
MQLFRITLEKWAGKLVSSGFASRWNSNGIEVLYFASSRALACLENVVRLHGDELSAKFKVTVIDVSENLVEDLDINKLPDNWYFTDPSAYELCRPFGDKWVKSNSSLLLKVPSAIIKNEYNFLVNPKHSDFNKIKLRGIEPFYFDPRIKNK